MWNHGEVAMGEHGLCTWGSNWQGLDMEVAEHFCRPPPTKELIFVGSTPAQKSAIAPEDRKERADMVLALSWLR
jgi:hypothetical protein